MLMRTLVVVFLLATSASGQGTARTVEGTHYPSVIRAEVPLYPPLARTAHVTGTVEIQVTVENGSVVEAQVKSPNFPGSPALSNPALANIRTWQFQLEDRATFLVTYVFQIEGEETLLPENPRVELDLPLLVKVTARPFKPTCSDCTPAFRGTRVPQGR